MHCKTIIPTSLLVNNTWFTSVSVIGSLDKTVYYSHPHRDYNDIVSCVFYFGEGVHGGNSTFYDGLNAQQYSDCVHVTRFLHGQIISDEFSDIVHGVSEWKGLRLVIVFYTNKKIYNHFLTYGNRFYKTYETLDFPKSYIDPINYKN